jgi:hypothetical protein
MSRSLEGAMNRLQRHASANQVATLEFLSATQPVITMRLVVVAQVEVAGLFSF